MNLPRLLDVLDELGIENPIVCANINKIGFRMCGGIERLRATRCASAGSGPSRCRSSPPARSRRARRSSRSARSRTSSRSSSAPRAARTSRARGRSSPSTGASSADHAPRRLHRRAPEAAPPAAPPARRHRGPVRWATFDTPQSRSLLEGEDVDFVHFVGGRDPATWRATCRPRAGSSASTRSTRWSAPVRRWRCRSSRSGGPAGWRCHYIESAARSEGPSMTAS